VLVLVLALDLVPGILCRSAESLPCADLSLGAASWASCLSAQLLVWLMTAVLDQNVMCTG
jgi:hypothetical protein